VELTTDKPIRAAPEKSWLGLWQKPRGDHVFAKHIAFRVNSGDAKGDRLAEIAGDIARKSRRI
jgi:hypothetical protein